MSAEAAQKGELGNETVIRLANKNRQARCLEQLSLTLTGVA